MGRPSAIAGAPTDSPMIDDEQNARASSLMCVIAPRPGLQIREGVR